MTTTESDEKPRGPVFRFLSRLANLIWWLLLALIVLSALYAGIGRQLTQNIHEYIPEFEQRLSEQLGQEVEIGSLYAVWSWLNPTLVASDLVVRQSGDSDEVVGSLKTLRVGLDFLASVARFRIVFSNFEADRLELIINQTPRGDVSVEGVDLPEPVANDLSKWIDLAGQWLSDPSVRVTRVDLGLRDSEGKLRHVEIPQLDLVYRRGFFHAAGRAMRPGTTEQLARFELVGQHFFRGDFTGQVYGNINSGRLFDGLVREYSWEGLRIEGFDLGGEVWLTFHNGTIIQANGTVTTPYVQVGVHQESLAPFEDISARFGWRRSPDALSHGAPEDPVRPWYTTGEYHFQDVSWRWNGESFPGFDVRLQSNDEAYLISAEDLPIGPLRRLITDTGLAPETARNQLLAYQPEGTLNNVRLDLPRQNPESFTFGAALKNVDVAAVGGSPSVRGLDGQLFLTREAGYVDADAAEMNFGFPGLFNGNWDVSQFQAGVAWRLEDGITRVYSDDIRMQIDSGATLTGAFDLRLAREGRDVLGLRVGVENGTAGMLADFVPAKVVNPGLYDWLVTSIPTATIDGDYFGHGQIGRDAPGGSFVSSMRFAFSDAEIRYDERWPSVESASGAVSIHQGRTRVELVSGRTGGIDLRPGKVQVVPADTGTEIQIEASAPVSGEALKHWMIHSPLGEMAGAAGESVELAGEFELDLGLAFALNSELPPNVDASVTAKSGTLSYPAANLQWTQLGGKLDYSSEKGFSGVPLEANFLGRPVAVWFSRSEDGSALNIRQAGKADLASLLEMTDLPDAKTLKINGSLNYEATLDVSPESASTIVLTTDLVGVGVDWPSPLGKLPVQSAPLTIQVEPGDSDAVAIAVSWEERADLVLQWQSDRILTRIRQLYIGQRQIQDVSIDAQKDAQKWFISADSDWLLGAMTWPLESDDLAKPVVVDLKRLHLERAPDSEDAQPVEIDSEAQVEAFRALKLESWPDINVQIAELAIDGRKAGNWSFEVRPEADALKVSDLKGSFLSMAFDGQMIWAIPDGRELTRFRGELRGESLADIGALVGSDVPFKNKKSVVAMDLNWPGRPDQFTTSRLSGTTRMRFDDGVILEGNNTAQLFRIFNILNSDTLWRRLQLDFSDLYEAGVAFDAISGKATMDRGVLTLDPELQIVGPSGAFKFTGKTDMASETLDMNMVVVLPLTQNLPLAALLLGAGAPIGGALFVLDKVLGDPLSKLTSATYSVKGPWDKPDVDLKRVFDTGN